jgi:hypothetical protein
MRLNTWRKCSGRSDLFVRTPLVDRRNREGKSHVASDTLSADLCKFVVSLGPAAGTPVVFDFR